MTKDCHLDLFCCHPLERKGGTLIVTLIFCIVTLCLRKMVYSYTFLEKLH